jgi:hypothetical protein
MDTLVRLLDVQVTVMHMGALHAYERWLTFALAFGPFVLLAVVYVVRRRQDAGQDAGEEAGSAGQPVAADPLLDVEGGLEQVGDHRLQLAADQRDADPDR